jgi:hypothetical protein
MSSVYRAMQSPRDLPEITTQQITHFFAPTRDLEPGKWVRVVGWVGPEKRRARNHRGCGAVRPSGTLIAVSTSRARRGCGQHRLSRLRDDAGSFSAERRGRAMCRSIVHVFHRLSRLTVAPDGERSLRGKCCCRDVLLSSLGSALVSTWRQAHSTEAAMRVTRN